MELLKKLFNNDKKSDDEKDKKNKPISNWILLLIIGFVLLLLGSGIFEKKEVIKEAEIDKTNVNNIDETKKTYEQEMEKRLKDILSKVSGAGDIEVMLTISYGKELVIANDTMTNEDLSEEKDSTGGSRNTKNYSQDKKTVIRNSQNGNDQPIILKEIEPKIEGIIIVAQGGGDLIVETNLRKAAQALFNIPAHKIEVFKMK